MQQEGNAALAAAVEADHRTIVFKFEADWDRDGSWDHALSDLTSVVKSMVIDRDMVSTLPPETTIVEGYYGAVMNVTLGGKRPGDTATIAGLLSPWRADSPLYVSGRQLVKVRGWIGHRLATGGDVLLQQFDGVISSLGVDSETGTIRLICADGVAACQNPIDLPLFSLPPPSAVFRGVSMSIRTNTQWVVDYAFRQCGYFMSPPHHSRVFYSQTMHGSVAPDVGFAAEFWIGEGFLGEADPLYIPGRPGWGLAYGGNRNWWGMVRGRGMATAFLMKPNQTIVMQCQVDSSRMKEVFAGQDGVLAVYSSGNGYYSGASFTYRLNPNTGKMTVQAHNGISLVATIEGPVVPADGWFDYWVEIELGASLGSCVVRFPGMTLFGVDLSGLNGAAITTYPHIHTAAQIPIHDLRFSDRTGLATGTTRYDPATWVPQVDIDTGLNEVSGIPIRRGVPAWDLIKEVVGAEYGVVGFDESGRPFFKNRNTVRRATLTTQKVLTQEKLLTQLSLREEAASIRNTIAVSWEPKQLPPQTTAASWSTVWSLKDASDLLLEIGITRIEVTLDEEGALADPYNPPILQTTAQWNDPAIDSRHAFVAQRWGSPGEVTSGVTISVLPLSPNAGYDRVRISIDNNSGTWLRLQTSDGSPALRIRGMTRNTGTQGRAIYPASGSVAKYGARTLPIPQSEWHQLAIPMRNLALSLLSDLGSPVPIIDNVAAVGDPRLQLLDSVSAEDKDRLGGPMFTICAGIRRALEVSDVGAKLTDSLNLRPVAAPGRWILGHATWGVLGQTTRL